MGVVGKGKGKGEGRGEREATGVTQLMVECKLNIGTFRLLACMQACTLKYVSVYACI